MMSYTSPSEWQPLGISSLEPAAWEAVRSTDNVCIMAGPGSGKTELLAQRAAYLLQTGICAPPYKILAISFKRDAAANLRERVRVRCGPELAKRLHAITFDAFTKGLVDRFATCIPQLWTPTSPYEIRFPKRREVDDILDLARTTAPPPWQHEISSIQSSSFESEYVGSWNLPLENHESQSGTEHAVQLWWETLLNRKPSQLTFVMLNRLSELLLRKTPTISKALNVTYPFIFVDEFQDTTYAQYNFLKSVFHGEKNVITAVGDEKQRIMGWAGAQEDSFKEFVADFGARKIPLLSNFRSSPDLVRVQTVVAKAMGFDASEAHSQVAKEIQDEAAQVWTFTRKRDEAYKIARFIRDDMSARGKAPRDYGVLVRQTSEKFERDLIPEFESVNLSIRNEAKLIGRIALQDLLVESAARLGLSLLRLATQERSPRDWNNLVGELAGDQGAELSSHRKSREFDSRLGELVNTLKVVCDSTVPSGALADDLTKMIFIFMDPARLSALYPEYSTGDHLEAVIEGFGSHLSNSSTGASSWNEAVNVFEGLDSIPLMTVHKSKGLEYDTMIFVGLDDAAWWSHKRGDIESISTFFVALSRAKQRAIFSFCSERGSRATVSDLYELLTNADVLETAY